MEAKNVGYKIVAVVHGNVLCGNVEWNEHGINITKAAVITRWGSDRGLGLLSFEGTQHHSLIHPCDDVFVPWGSLVFTMKSVPLIPLDELHEAVLE